MGLYITVDRFDPRTQSQLKANQANWDARAKVHAGSDFYSMACSPAAHFHPKEWADLGELKGRRVLHLQCHNGFETMAFAQRGAEVVGLDFSAQSLASAREYVKTAGVQIEFVESDVYDAVEALRARTFDIVYTGRAHCLISPI